MSLMIYPNNLVLERLYSIFAPNSKKIYSEIGKFELRPTHIAVDKSQFRTTTGRAAGVSGQNYNVYQKKMRRIVNQI